MSNFNFYFTLKCKLFLQEKNYLAGGCWLDTTINYLNLCRGKCLEVIGNQIWTFEDWIELKFCCVGKFLLGKMDQTTLHHVYFSFCVDFENSILYLNCVFIGPTLLVWKGTLHVGMETLLKICGVAAPAALLHWNSG